VKLSRDDYTAAERLLRAALIAHEKANPATWRLHYTQSLLGATLARCGRHPEAKPLLVSGYQGLLKRRASIPVENRGRILDDAEGWLDMLRSPGTSKNCS
jgi:hypothetical protein